MQGQFRDSVWQSTVKVGGEWLHTLNDQVFRGFFEGRYIFDGALASCVNASPCSRRGFGPTAVNVFPAPGHSLDGLLEVPLLTKHVLRAAV